MDLKEKLNEFIKTESIINEHLNILCYYGKDCNTIVDFGIKKGNSTIAFLNANPKSYYGYDVQLEKEAIEIIKEGKKLGIDAHIIKGMYSDIEIPQCDLLFLDTEPTAYCLADQLKNHQEKVKKYIIIPQTERFKYFGSDALKGLPVAINDFLNNNPSWMIKEQYENNNGLTILVRKDINSYPNPEKIVETPVIENVPETVVEETTPVVSETVVETSMGIVETFVDGKSYYSLSPEYQSTLPPPPPVIEPLKTNKQ